MIYINEDFLTKEECNKLIQYYKKNKNDSFLYRDTYPIDLKNGNHDDEFLNSIHERVKNLCQKFIDKELTYEFCDNALVKWPINSFQPKHTGPDEDIISALIYLNDDYDGGRTCFSDTFKVKPLAGRILLFSDAKYIHWVEPVGIKTRYTIIYWFTPSSKPFIG
jgi:predicted 2-oxoglutarate/Fe(II)-dependent dioxygenase YbiX